MISRRKTEWRIKRPRSVYWQNPQGEYVIRGGAQKRPRYRITLEMGGMKLHIRQVCDSLAEARQVVGDLIRADKKDDARLLAESRARRNWPAAEARRRNHRKTAKFRKIHRKKRK